MRSPLIVLFSVLLAAGCSSAPSNGTGSGPAQTGSSNRETANVQSASNVNQTVVPYKGLENVDPNAFNATTANIRQVNVNAPSNTIPLAGRTAPDDSIFYSTMNKKGEPMEIRVFNSDPVIARVERTISGKESSYKVFLKNGRTVDAPADKMANFAAIAPANILEAIGMGPKPQPGNNSGKGKQPE